MDQNTNMQNMQNAPAPGMKFCSHCGAQIPADAVICTACGRQVSDVQQAQPQIVINNSNNNSNTNTNVNNMVGMGGRARNKWVALVLCFFLGWLGIHKFYEGKVGMGILYMFTVGLFGIGVFVDFLILLFKPNPYFV